MRRYARGDPDAVEGLWALYRPQVIRWARPALGNASDAEECASEVLAIVLKTLGKFRNPAPEAFDAFIHRCADNVIRRMWRARSRGAFLEDLGESEEPSWADSLPDPHTNVDREASTADAADLLKSELDRALLELGETGDVGVALVALEMFYLERQPESEVLHCLGSLDPGLERPTLRGWLADPGLIRRLAFDYFYLEADRLSDALIDRYRASVESRGEPGPANAEAERVIALHYRYGLPVGEQDKASRGASLLSVDGVSLSPQEIRRLLEQADLEGYLRDRAARLSALLAQGAQRLDLPPERLLGAVDDRVWQRLAFQYYYGTQDRSQEQTWQLVSPLAQAFGHRLRPTDINNWTSGRRLMKNLVRHLAREHPEFVGKLRSLFQRGANSVRVELMLLRKWEGLGALLEHVGGSDEERAWILQQHAPRRQGRGRARAGPGGTQAKRAVLKAFERELGCALQPQGAEPDACHFVTPQVRAGLAQFRSAPDVQRARQALLLRYRQGRSAAEIAGQLGIAPKAVDRVLSRYETAIVEILTDQIQNDLRK